jgi:hypothetical protein
MQMSVDSAKARLDTQKSSRKAIMPIKVCNIIALQQNVAQC